MVQSKCRPWNEFTDVGFSEPVEEAYYLAARWQRDQRQRLLDLGCGSGRHAVFFAEQRFAVHAFDLSESGVAILRQKAKARNLVIRSDVGDMLELPYGSGCFDCVFAFHSIYHTDKEGIERVISEIHRVLVDGGEVYASFNSLENPTFHDPTNQRIDKNTIIKTRGVETGIPHYYVDEPEIRRLLVHFEILRFIHREEIKETRRRWHYCVLARKR